MWRFLRSFNGHIGSSIILTIEPRMVITFWEHSPICFKHMLPFWYQCKKIIYLYSRKRELGIYQCWSEIVHLWYHTDIDNEDSIFLIPVGYGIWHYFCFWDHSCLYTMQEPWWLGKIALVSIWFRIILNQILTPVYKDSLIFDNLGLQFWHPQVGSLIRFFILIIDTHSFTYIPVQHWYLQDGIFWCDATRLSSHWTKWGKLYPHQT